MRNEIKKLKSGEKDKAETDIEGKLRVGERAETEIQHRGPLNKWSKPASQIQIVSRRDLSRLHLHLAVSPEPALKSLFSS